VDSIVYTNFEDIYRVFSAIIFAALTIGLVGTFVPDASTAKAAAKTVFEIIDRSPRIDATSESSGVKLDSINGDIQFQGVNFAYPARPQVEVLKNFNLRGVSTRKKTLALVGTSGSGKSTIISLIGRVYDPSAGAVVMGGHDIKQLNLKWLRSQIAIVSQEPVLFDASIAENIRYGALFREVSDEEVVSAAKSANIHGFIETLPQVSG
jgi:ABC-type multidrug transport system fused ATPase/permease subunit